MRLHDFVGLQRILGYALKAHRSLLCDLARGRTSDRDIHFGIELDDAGIDFALNTGQRQHVEHALAMTQQIDDLFTALDHDGVSLDHQVDFGGVLVELIAQVAKDVSHRFELDTGIEQMLHSFEFEQVLIGVGATAATTGCG